MADLVAATRAVAVGAGIAQGRIFGVELPESEHDSMPRACAVVRPSGGGTATRHRMPAGVQRVDIRHYGETPWEAAEIEQAMASLLHFFTQQTVDVDGTPVLVRSFVQAGGVNQLRDPDTDWPYALTTWQVFGDRY